MLNCIHAGRLTLLGLVLAASGAGCHTIQPSTPLTIHVRDAETQKPIPDATVRVIRFGKHSSDRDVVFTSEADGTAHTRLPQLDAAGVMVEIEAPGYLSKQTTLPRDIADALMEAKPFHPYKGPALAVSVDVFAGPRPTAELVLPTGYRGLVKAEIRVNPDQQWTAGQRAYSYAIAPNSVIQVGGAQKIVVQIDGPPVFGQGVGPDIVAKYADGRQLPKEAKGEDIGFRWIRRDGNDVYFVVGNNTDLTMAGRMLGVSDQNSNQDNSKKKQGGGGGGRQGGMGGGGMGGNGMGGRGGRGGMGGPGSPY